MSEYTEFSDIISPGEDNRFNEIWEESMSIPEEENERVSAAVPAPIAADSASLKSPPNPTPPTNVKPQRQELMISDITADNQSITSSISKTSLSLILDGDRSDISTARVEKNDSTCVNVLESLSVDQAMSIPACVSKKIPSCVSEEAILQKVSDDVLKVTVKSDAAKNFANVRGKFSPSLFTEKTNIIDEVPKTETTSSRSKKKQTTFNSDKTDASSKPVRKTRLFNICFNDARPITSIAELLESTAHHFASSPLSGADGDCSVVSAICIKAKGKKLQEQKSDEKVTAAIPHILSDITSDTQAITLEEKRMDESLLDSLLPEATIEPQSPEESEKPNEDPKDDAAEEENITEGLGLNLPPESPRIEIEESKDTQPKAEINDGTDKADSSDDVVVETSDSFNRDILIKYRIGGYQSDCDEEGMSESGFSETSSTPILKPKQRSERKSFFKPKWGRRLFSSGNKDKEKDKVNTNGSTTKKIKTKKNGITKTAKSLCDSPGSATVGTAETTQSIAQYAAINFAADHPANPKKVSFVLRPRSKTRA